MTAATKQPTKDITLDRVKIDGEAFFKISNHDQMAPFFMSIVSDSNHWMFISSNGGLTAGRKNADFSLFPYYTDDKITESSDRTGSKTIIRIDQQGKMLIWEPFSIRNQGRYKTSQNLYKNESGNKIMFEEINHDLGLAFRYKWSSSNDYGFIRESFLKNITNEIVDLEIIDGIQNIVPYGVNADLQGIRSNLVDAYKKNELEADAGLGIYALSAIIVDRAEPSEALRANVAWSLGMKGATHLITSQQLDNFRKGMPVTQEVDSKATRGAYLLNESISLSSEEEKHWIIVANVNQNISDIEALRHRINQGQGLKKAIMEDIEVGTQRLKRLVSAADGFQKSSDEKRNARHYSNTLFNIMRGGIFDLDYQIEKWDFEKYLKQANPEVAKDAQKLLDRLPELFTQQELKGQLASQQNIDFTRLAMEYMPLKFSRRHGDPSRPWNKFSINTRSEEDGSKILDYEGNWRDIFQNWEALAHSYPEFIDSMIFKFLNASTFDGYNPYRVTKDGFDWETIEPHDPWSYIGYWGDHQIIYLLKFLEFIQNYFPERLPDYFDKDLFVYANVPYKIKEYKDLLADPKDTILFDDDLDREIRKRREEMGADGALLTDQSGVIYRVNFIEKILATSLAKLSNFVPEAGIWLNTQRPEWNDANNALVGNGVSMVTLYYLRRFFAFFSEVLPKYDGSAVSISEKTVEFFNAVNKTFRDNTDLLSEAISDKDRKAIMDQLGQAGCKFREAIYKDGFSGKKKSIQIEEFKKFAKSCQEFLEHAIEANQRQDGMFHAYNLISISEDEVSVSYLSEMLEGQVAALSSGYLTPEKALQVLDSMKSSKLFREDQYSYLLYPNKELPRFADKNNIPESRVKDSQLLQKLVTEDNQQIIQRDINGIYHFNGSFNNAQSVKKAFEKLPQKYAKLLEQDKDLVLEIFEEVFNHKAFTGRSGTFFGYEGLGSIYWHMVSKLQLAVEEVCLSAIHGGASPEVVGKLLEHYYEINEGIGVHKPPKLYGAFPIDPYSHTPWGKGVQQPGMTGQVKEDILSRMGELGIFVVDGKLTFDPCLLRKTEFLQVDKNFTFIDLNQEERTISLPAGSLAFTFCQVPVIFEISNHNQVTVVKKNGKEGFENSLQVSKQLSQSIFDRTREVERIEVKLDQQQLK